MDSGILMIQDSILICSPDPRIPHTALELSAMAGEGCLFGWEFHLVVIGLNLYFFDQFTERRNGCLFTVAINAKTF
jgi:hypothetical protein